MKKASIYYHGTRHFSRYACNARRRTLLLASSCILAGTYVLLLSFSPRFSTLNAIVTHTPSIVEATASDVTKADDSIIIEKLGLSLPLGPKEADLKKGAWLRYGDRSNPEIGGNTVIAGHRFEIGWTPWQTKKRSPFYKLNLVTKGDIVKIIYAGKLHSYRVSKTYHVAATETWIEDNSAEPKLTIYSCDLGGADKGRIVVEALPVEIKE